MALFRGIDFAGVRGGEWFPSKFGANTIKQTRGAFNGIQREFLRERDGLLVRAALRADNAQEVKQERRFPWQRLNYRKRKLRRN